MRSRGDYSTYLYLFGGLSGYFQRLQPQPLRPNLIPQPHQISKQPVSTRYARR
jgi:hypothetical protein